LPSGMHFVGSHPLAGSEKRGPQYADAYLFHNRWVVLTPTERTASAALERTRALWQALGAKVKVLSPAEHDRGLALTSHLPHLLASTLAGVLPQDLLDLAATGFRDTTRIAAGDPALWTAIFSQNRQALLEALGRFDLNLQALRSALEKQDWTELDRLLSQAKKVRDALGS
jgi:prephenate dehydrogenase